MWWPSARALRVGLSADEMVVAPAGHAACAVVACGPNASGSEAWTAPVATLTHWLATHARRRQAVHVVLSGRFVRWQLLAWRAELSRPAEIAAYARLRFRETFGKHADDWRVLPALQRPGHAVPACAVDTALLEALHAACAAAGVRLASVRPYFSCAFDHWRGALGRKPACFGLVERDCLALALVQGGDWVGLHHQRLNGDWRELIPGLLAQLGIPAGIDTVGAPLFLAGPVAPPPTAAGLPFVWLQPSTGARGAVADLRMAMGV